MNITVFVPLINTSGGSLPPQLVVASATTFKLVERPLKSQCTMLNSCNLPAIHKMKKILSLSDRADILPSIGLRTASLNLRPEWGADISVHQADISVRRAHVSVHSVDVSVYRPKIKVFLILNKVDRLCPVIDLKDCPAQDQIGKTRNDKITCFAHREHPDYNLSLVRLTGLLKMSASWIKNINYIILVVPLLHQ